MLHNEFKTPYALVNILEIDICLRHRSKTESREAIAKLFQFI